MVAILQKKTGVAAVEGLHALVDPTCIFLTDWYTDKNWREKTENADDLFTPTLERFNAYSSQYEMDSAFVVLD